MSFIVRKKMSEYLIKIINRVIGILKILCWKILYGSRFHSGKMTFFYPGCHLMIEKTGSINIGDNCFFNRDCSMTSLGEINIGNDCIFGENVKIYDHNHRTDATKGPFRKQVMLLDELKLDLNVWIGSDVLILPNIRIGDNVIIAAGAIVTKDIPDNVTYIQKRNSVEVPNGK